VEDGGGYSGVCMEHGACPMSRAGHISIAHTLIPDVESRAHLYQLIHQSIARAQPASLQCVLNIVDGST
jgi:hypothetical protein